jgi:hypothetical protein
MFLHPHINLLLLIKPQTTIAMKKFKITLLLGLVLILATSTTIDNELEEMIIGVWVYKDYNDSSLVYQKRSKFNSNESGIEFKHNGKLLKRQNVGWCGTPPISYENYKGTWKKSTDSTVTIRYKYWGGMAEQDLLIIKITNEKMLLRSLDYRTNEQ